MFCNQFGDFIDLDPDLDSKKSEDPDPQHWNFHCTLAGRGVKSSFVLSNPLYLGEINIFGNVGGGAKIYFGQILTPDVLSVTSAGRSTTTRRTPSSATAAGSASTQSSSTLSPPGKNHTIYVH